jgi:hypothetical protein
MQSASISAMPMSMAVNSCAAISGWRVMPSTAETEIFLIASAATTAPIPIGSVVMSDSRTLFIFDASL